jgi:hypothetical protein
VVQIGKTSGPKNGEIDETGGPLYNKRIKKHHVVTKKGGTTSQLMKCVKFRPYIFFISIRQSLLVWKRVGKLENDTKQLKLDPNVVCLQHGH